MPGFIASEPLVEAGEYFLTAAIKLQNTLFDYEKAFDSFETSAVMQGLRNQGVDEPYVKIPENIYKGSTVTIVLHKESNRIPAETESGKEIQALLCGSLHVYKRYSEHSIGSRGDYYLYNTADLAIQAGRAKMQSIEEQNS